MGFVGPHQVAFAPWAGVHLKGGRAGDQPDLHKYAKTKSAYAQH